jgi:hypothetical protein
MSKLSQNEMEPNSQEPIPREQHSSWGSLIFVGLTKIPIFGDSLRILNSYTYDGDIDSDFGFAPLHFWIKKHWFNAICVTLLTMISTSPACLNEILTKYVPEVTVTASTPKDGIGALIVSIFPNLLGFGIGVYALIFSLSASFVKSLQQQIESQNAADTKSKGHALLLNADMAYPLLVVAISIGIGVIQQIFPDAKWLITASWTALWYSLLMVLEILFVLFSLGESEILNKLK